MDAPSRRTLVLDADGVLLDWFKGFAGWMSAKGLAPERVYPTIYNMADTLPHVPWERIDAEIALFSRSEGFERLSFIEGAMDGLARIRAAAPSLSVRVLTAAGADPVVTEARRRCLRPIRAERIDVIPLHVSKKPWLETLPARSIVVEDTPAHAASAAELGHSAILIDQPWNRHSDHPCVKRVAGWDEAASAILGEVGGSSLA